MKNRSNLFHVVRYVYRDDAVLEDIQVVGTYRTVERADEIAGSYNQRVKDGNLHEDFQFGVQIGTYYDE